MPELAKTTTVKSAKQTKSKRCRSLSPASRLDPAPKREKLVRRNSVIFDHGRIDKKFEEYLYFQYLDNEQDEMERKYEEETESILQAYEQYLNPCDSGPD